MNEAPHSLDGLERIPLSLARSGFHVRKSASSIVSGVLTTYLPEGMA